MKLLNRLNEGLHDTCHVWLEEMKFTFKDEGVLIFFFLVPLLYPLLYSWIYNNEVVRDVPVAVVDMSNSGLSRKFIREYDAAPDVAVAYRCTDMAEAKKLVEQQKVHGIIYIPSDFSANINRMQQTAVSVYCDMSLLITYKAIYATAIGVATDVNSGIQISLSGNYTGREDQITTHPLAVEEVEIYNTTGGYGNFIIPGVLILIIQQTLVLGIGLLAGTARERNRNKQLVPISKHYNGMFRIVFGKTMCYFMVYAVMAAYLTLVVPRLFRFTSLVDPTSLAWLLLPYILSCIFFGMVMSCVVRYRENVLLIVVFTSVPLLFLAGVSWPQSSIPGAWQGVSWLFPSTFGVRAFIRMSTMGATMEDVLPEYNALWMQVIAYFLAACLVYRHQIKMAQTRR